MKKPSIPVEHRIEQWPEVPGSPGSLPPAALTFAMTGEDVMAAPVVRQWVSDGESWYSDWPGASGAESCCTHLCSLGDLVGDAHEVWGHRRQLDQSDQLLCRLGADGQWIIPPGKGFDGELSRARVVAMRETAAF